MNESTLVLIKPDGLHKSLTGNILSKMSQTRLEIVAAKMVRVSRALAETHYEHMKKEPFFEDLIKYIMGEFHRKKVLALVYHGADAIRKVRDVVGATNPEEADAMSIRGAYGRITTKGLYENVVHASSSTKDAEREIKLWFDPDEIIVRLYKEQTVTEEACKVRRWA